MSHRRGGSNKARRSFATVVLAAVLAALSAEPAAAEENDSHLPLWELGLLLIGGSFPDYPASNQNHYHALPIPYMVYRGHYFRLSSTSARGIVYVTALISFDFSVSGAFPSSSTDRARAGMPSLAYTLQIGPRMNVLLWRFNSASKLDVEIPVRTVISTSLNNFAFRGFVLAPEIAYANDHFLFDRGHLKIGVGPVFATTRLMDYFYAVPAEFAIPGRAPFEANGGYLGSILDASYRVPLNKRINLFAAIVPQVYYGATNEESPLFKRRWGLSAGLGLSYSFFISETKVGGEVE
jgi:MipA family protein